ncbi:unnamed protein product [Hermetia illucens]|uniref:Gamma-butyrobetaine dioxygenase n=1 Tax=Hermetia illucens TaxID=343691 RepID=A0A7R8UB41_HERIL|nr:gamma-butyrobetaine dioxygenase-like isoform X2 [Hermetia illucens]CAD7077504.1 unnamed protein product [Hermetia illucens]
MFARFLPRSPHAEIYTQIRSLLTASIESQYVRVNHDEKSMKFPQIWLRDNCCCPECFHEGTQSRIYKFKVGVRAERVQALDDKSVQIEWNDRHTSVYNLKWLGERDFSPENRQKYIDEFYRLKHVFWGKEDFKKECKEFEFDEVMGTNEGLRKWMEALAIYGVALINNSPKEKTTARRLADRVGFIRKTHYGEEFSVMSKPDAKNYAYLSAPLPLHTDLPYYEYKPGLNLLHCFTQSESSGGQSLTADAFYVAERLKQKDPKSYEILTKVPVDWNDIGSEGGGEGFHSIYRSPMINFDADGRYNRINLSIPQRDSHFTVKLEEVIPWYEAYWKLIEILKEETTTFKLKEGQLLTFNNLRVLHGRTGYDDNETNVRHIIGVYLDWDIVYARWRVLKSGK